MLMASCWLAMKVETTSFGNRYLKSSMLVYLPKFAALLLRDHSGMTSLLESYGSVDVML